jgi:hypothetical protein
MIGELTVSSALDDVEPVAYLPRVDFICVA